MTVKSRRELWRDYLFLTREMAKFLEKKDFDMFSEILTQRAAIQGIIDETATDGFEVSPEGRQLLQQVKQKEDLIKTRLRVLSNSVKQEQTVSQAYDPYAAAANVGRRMDRQS